MLVNITEHYFLQIICPGFFFSLAVFKCRAVLACCSATRMTLSFVHILLAYEKGYGSKPKQNSEWSSEGVNTDNFPTTPAAKLAPNVMPCIPMYLIGVVGWLM